MREYYEGILLFQLTDEKVWSKASQDTTGLRAYHEANKMKYMWGARTDADIFTAANGDVAKSAAKLARKGKLTNEQILAKINKSNALNLRVVSGKFEPKAQPAIDSIAPATVGVSRIFKQDGNLTFVRVKALLPPQPKNLDEVRGLATSDYQNYLESKWVDDLKNRYPIQVDSTVLNSILPPQ